MKGKTDKAPVKPAKSPADGRDAIIERLDRIIWLLEGVAARFAPPPPAPRGPAMSEWTQTPGWSPTPMPKAPSWPTDAWGNPVSYAMTVEAQSCRRT